jgi:hypothetical protein
MSLAGEGKGSGRPGRFIVAALALLALAALGVWGTAAGPTSSGRRADAAQTRNSNDDRALAVAHVANSDLAHAPRHTPAEGSAVPSVAQPISHDASGPGTLRFATPDSSRIPLGQPSASEDYYSVKPFALPKQAMTPPPAPPLAVAAGLSPEEKVRLFGRLERAGYPKRHHIDLDLIPAKLARTPLTSHLLLSPCDVANPLYTVPDCDVIERVRAELDLLDAEIIAKRGIRKVKKESPGQGYAARGWGIAGPFTNKWRYYWHHLETVARDPRRLLRGEGGAAASHRGVHLCEVGFLAGHSTATFAGLLGRNNFARVSIFDYPQPKSVYAYVGSAHMLSRFPPSTLFDFYAGGSRDLVAAAVSSGRLDQCDYVSLDGSKLPPDVFADLKNFAYVAHAASVVVCDDVNTVHVVNGLVKIATSGKVAALDVSEHNGILSALVAIGALEIVDIWHSDVEKWPYYGNIALRYKLFGDAFADAVARLVRRQHPQLSQLPVSRGVHSCEVAVGNGVPVSCCSVQHSMVSSEGPGVAALVNTANPVLRNRWSTIARTLATCRPIKVDGGDACSTAPVAASRASLVNAYSHFVHLIDTVARRRKGTMSRMCVFGAVGAEAERLSAAFHLIGVQQTTAFVPMGMASSAAGAARFDGECAALPRAQFHTYNPAADPGTITAALDACSGIVVDAAGLERLSRSASSAAAAAANTEALVEGLIELMGAPQASERELFVVVANVNAAAIYAAGSSRPVTKAASDVTRLSQFTAGTAPAPLAGVELQLALAVLRWQLKVVGADFPTAVVHSATGSLLFSRSGPPVDEKPNVLYAVPDVLMVGSSAEARVDTEDDERALQAMLDATLPLLPRE